MTVRVRWTKDQAETFPALGLRLEPGEQEVTDEEYAAIRKSPWVEAAPATKKKAEAAAAPLPGNSHAPTAPEQQEG